MDKPDDAISVRHLAGAVETPGPLLNAAPGPEPVATFTLRLVPSGDRPRLGAGASEPQAGDSVASRNCSHWPMNAPDGIRAASAALQDLVRLWDHAERLLPETDPARVDARESGNVRVEEIEFDLLLLKLALVPDAALAINKALLDLAEQFAAVTQWLMRSAQASCDAVQRAPPQAQGQALLRDDHRVIARDWLSADMNAAIARALLRASRVLASMDLSPRAIHEDLLGSRSFRAPLQAAAAMVECSGALATECAVFVQSFDAQWVGLRREIASTMALYPLGDGAPTLSRRA